MSFDQKTLKALMALDDATLWKAVCAIAAARGITLPEAPPPPEDFERLRGAIAGIGKETPDVGAALKIIDRYRRSQP